MLFYNVFGKKSSVLNKKNAVLTETKQRRRGTGTFSKTSNKAVQQIFAAQKKTGTTQRLSRLHIPNDAVLIKYTERLRLSQTHRAVRFSSSVPNDTSQLSISGFSKERVAFFSPLSSGNMVPAGITGRMRGLMKAFAVRAETALLR